MRLIFWFASVTGWDGILPLVGVASIATVQFAFPQNDLAEMTVAILIPMVVAMVRAAIAVNQLKRRCHGLAPLGRQVVLAGAITLLFLFEIGSSLIAFSKDAPISVWIGTVVLYLAYLASICWALRPASEDMPIEPE